MLEKSSIVFVCVFVQVILHVFILYMVMNTLDFLFGITDGDMHPWEGFTYELFIFDDFYLMFFCDVFQW